MLVKLLLLFIAFLAIRIPWMLAVFFFRMFRPAILFSFGALCGYVISHQEVGVDIVTVQQVGAQLISSKEFEVLSENATRLSATLIDEARPVFEKFLQP